MGNVTEENTTEVIYHACNFVASITTAFFFWNKVQSWQLSTTTMEEKGLTPKKLHRFNQGRGVVAMILFSLFPLVCLCLPKQILESELFSTGLALSLIAGSASVYRLVRDYGKLMWAVYGMTPMALGISMLGSSFRHGTVASINENYPMILDRFQKEASFVISCVQMGFMLYYLYSRNVVTQRTVQKICKTYHVTLSMIFLFRVERDLWLQFTGTSTSNTGFGSSMIVPWPMMVQPTILTVAMTAKILPLILKVILSMGVKIVNINQVSKESSSPSLERIQSVLQHHQQSQAKNTALATRRRSSKSTRIESVCR